MCELYHKSNWGRSDYPWALRNGDDSRLAAEQWKNAPTKPAADAIFNTLGVRYTELWRLPYLNPIVQLTVDPMHCLLEGLVERHFKEVLKLTLGRSRTSRTTSNPAISHQFQSLPANVSAWSEHDKIQVPELHRILLSPVDMNERVALVNKLSKQNLKPLIFVCESLNIKPTVSGRRVLKSDWAEVLANWVS